MNALPRPMRRIGFALVYFGSEILFCLTLALVSSEAAFSLYWTVWQGESSYYFWHTFFGLHPLKGYLLIVLSVSTVRLTAMWFVFFRGEGTLLETPFGRRIFDPERFPRLWAEARKKRSRRFLFLVGLIPAVWWIGYLALRERPVGWGVPMVLSGNVVKLSVFAFAFWLGTGHSAAYLVIVAIVIASFLPRFAEIFVPAGQGA